MGLNAYMHFNPFNGHKYKYKRKSTQHKYCARDIHNVSFINKSSQYFLRMQYKIEKHRVKNE